MTTSLVITFTGPDRPGIVDHLSGLVESFQGNWEKSSMGCLSGRFAGILQVTLPDEQVAPLVAALKGPKAMGLSVLVDRGEEAQEVREAQRLQLSLTGTDHAGIVHEIAHRVAEKGISIDDLSSSKFVAPMSGESMFSAELCLIVPNEVSLDELQHELELLAHDLVVDLNIDNEER